MGKGLALEFKKRHPKMYDDYKKECEKGNLSIGKPHLYRECADHWILNFPTKKHWRQKSKLEYIEAGLRTFVKKYKEWNIKSIAFPQLGCQLGGLSWTEVKPLMEHYLGNLDELSVVIYSGRSRLKERLKEKKIRRKRKLRREQGNEQTELTKYVL